MNNKIAIVLFITLLCSLSVTSQGKCSKFYPAEVGVSHTLTLYDQDDLEQGTITYKVKEVVGDKIIYSVSMAKSGMGVMERDQTMTCTDGGVSIDFSSMGAGMTSGYRNTDADITGNNIYLPNDLELNMSLDDANMVITTTVNAGVTNVTSTMNMRMYDRTVEKIEDVVTPVRLFPDCYKLVYYREMSMSTPSRSGGSPTVSVLSRTKTEQWMAVGIGVVKTKEYNIEIAGGSDTYDLQGWSELTSID